MELNRKKSKKKKIELKTKILLIILFVIIDIFLIFSFIRIKDAVNDNHLNNRFRELLDISFTSNDYDNSISTTGKYKDVEKAMNEYFINYSNKAKEVLDIINDDKIKNLLSVDNYNKDPKLTDSISYVTSTREDLDNRFNELYNYSSEEYIEEFIKKRSNDKKVKFLFKKYMYSIDSNNHFDDCNSLLKAKQDQVNNILDVSKEVFTFLASNEGKWIIKDNQIQFANNSLKEQYDGYISRIK